MKFSVAFATIFFGLLSFKAFAGKIEQHTSLYDLFRIPSERLSGRSIAKEYFFPLPVPIDQTVSVSGKLVFRPSPLLGSNCMADLKVNDRTVAVKAFSGNREQVIVPFEVPPDLENSFSKRESLKITAEFTLVGPKERFPNEIFPSENRWVEIDSKSGIRVVFDNSGPDWLSPSRLPQSLRETIFLQIPAEPNEAQRDMLVRAASWFGYVKPHAEIHVVPEGSSTPENTDSIFLVEPEPTGELIRLIPDGSRRKVFFAASSQEDVERLWKELTFISRHWVPREGGWHSYRQNMEPGAEGPSTVSVEFFSPSFVRTNSGTGETFRNLVFDHAFFAEQPVNLSLFLTGTYGKVRDDGSLTLSVFLNKNVLFEEELEENGNRFAREIELPSELLRGENVLDVSLRYSSPDQDSAESMFDFFWKIDPRSHLSVSDYANGPAPDSLLESAQIYFGRESYAILLSDERDLAGACLVAVWLQRVNSSAILSPHLTGTIPENGPLVAVGKWRASLGEEVDFPVEIKQGPDAKDTDDLNVLSERDDFSIGILQLGFRGPDSPVILLESLGRDGPRAMKALMQDVANEPWRGDGNFLMGDGDDVPLSVGSHIEAPEELRTILSVREAGFSWEKWRWFIAGGIWFLFSLIIFWIFTKSRQNAVRG